MGIKDTFKKAKDKIAETYNKGVSAGASKLIDSDYTIKTMIELDDFITSSKLVHNVETGQEFKKQIIAIFADKQSDFYKKVIYYIPMMMAKSFARNINIKLVDTNIEGLDLNRFQITTLPTLLFIENEEIIKSITGENEILAILKSPNLSIDNAIIGGNQNQQNSQNTNTGNIQQNGQVMQNINNGNLQQQNNFPQQNGNFVNNGVVQQNIGNNSQQTNQIPNQNFQQVNNSNIQQNVQQNQTNIQNGQNLNNGVQITQNGNIQPQNNFPPQNNHNFPQNLAQNNGIQNNIPQQTIPGNVQNIGTVENNMQNGNLAQNSQQNGQFNQNIGNN